VTVIKDNLDSMKEELGIDKMDINMKEIMDLPKKNK
jgi:hypothetical protein